MTRKKRIEEILQDESEENLIEAWNKMCERDGWSDSIYPMSCLEDFMGEKSFMEGKDEIDWDDFNFSDNYFYAKESDGLFHSTSLVEDDVVEISDLANAIERDEWAYDSIIDLTSLDDEECWDEPLDEDE